MKGIKYTSIALLLIALLASCGGKSDLDKLKAEEAKLSSKIESLETELKALKSQIAELDTTLVEQVKKTLVTVISLKESEYKHYIEVQGKSYAENNVMVTTEMGGLVKAVYVDEGQFVNKGKTLIQLDNSIIQNQIAELQTSMSLAKDVFDKRQRLWDQNIGSEIEYLQAKNNYESLQDKLATAQTQLYKMSIKAPISGYVDNINVKIGEMAAPGAPAVQVVNTGNMEVHADLPETYLGKVNRSDVILVSFPALGVEKEAVVKSVGQTISPNNRTFKVIATVENKDGLIKPNLLSEIKIKDEEVKDAITIPPRLLQEAADSYFVFVATQDSLGDMVAKRVNVTTGSSYDTAMLITSGLNKGDLLIDAGYRDVREGKQVEISE